MLPHQPRPTMAAFIICVRSPIAAAGLSVALSPSIDRIQNGAKKLCLLLGNTSRRCVRPGEPHVDDHCGALTALGTLNSAAPSMRLLVGLGRAGHSAAQPS